MVPNLSKGAGIKGTALYVLHEVRDEGERALGAALTPDQQSADRIGMTATRNLSTDDPELAWRLMCATALNREALKEAAGVHKGGRPSKYQCGHISLSWEHETKPNQAEMLRAAEGALTSLGWEKLQALIVEHRDHDHAHCHIVVNLIDPETGRTAPNAKNDYEKLQRWAHVYDKDRGIEVCPNRAARMERVPDDPTPPEPIKRWLSRKEYEAVRAAERAEDRAAALGRYREAAAEVRERFRPEWAAHYREARAETRDQARYEKGNLAELARCKTATQRGEFAKRHHDLIWSGIAPEQRPGNAHTMLAPGFLERALQTAHGRQQAALLERQEAAKAALQARHSEARQEAYRAAWKRPEPAQVVPFPEKPAQDAPGKPKVGLAAALAVSAAGIAAYAFNRSQARKGTADPARDFEQAAERIRRQTTRAANANRLQPPAESAPVHKEPVVQAADQLHAKRHEAAALQAKAATRNEAIRRSHAEAARNLDRGPQRDRRRD